MSKIVEEDRELFDASTYHLIEIVQRIRASSRDCYSTPIWLGFIDMKQRGNLPEITMKRNALQSTG